MSILQSLEQSSENFLQDDHLLVGVPFGVWIPEIQLTSDASLMGCGAHCCGRSTQGLWSLEETSLHINLLELRAVRFALTVFSDMLRGKKVLINTDNVSALFYINKQGGTSSIALCMESLLLWNQVFALLSDL